MVYLEISPRQSGKTSRMLLDVKKYLDKGYKEIEGSIDQYTLATQADPADWRSRGRLYRAQQRKYYLDTYGTLPPATPDIAAETDNEKDTPQKTLDPERIQIDVLTPNLQLKTKTDTARNFKIRQ